MYSSFHRIDDEKWTLIHNSDWSGDAYVNLPGTLTQDLNAEAHPRVELVQGEPTRWNPTTGLPVQFNWIVRVSIPGELFHQIGRDSFRRDAIAALEDLE